MSDFWNMFYLLFSFLYAVSFARTLGTTWQFMRGKYKTLGFLKKFAYMWHRSNEPWIVFFANSQYCFEVFMAKVTTSLVMWWTYPVFLFYKFFRGRTFDFDFDELEEEGKKLSIKQGVVYHYWGDSRY
jgi:hypothetical protein